MGKRSRDKGMQYEQEKVRELNEVLRGERAGRSLQAGKGGIVGCDVDCPPFGIETKWCQSPKAGITATLENLADEVKKSRLARLPVFVWKVSTRKRNMAFKQRVILQWRHLLLMIWVLERTGGRDLLEELVRNENYEPWKAAGGDVGRPEDS